jgi:thioredoxin 1
MVHVIENKSQFDDALKSKKLVVIDCFATWCGPCKLIAPKVVTMSKENEDVDFYKLDVDEVSDVAAELAIRAMPTFLLFKDGEKVQEIVGANDKALKVSVSLSLASLSGGWLCTAGFGWENETLTML